MSSSVQFRLFIGGELVDDAPVMIGAGARDLIGELGAQHGAIARTANESGRTWMIEIVWPDGEHLRFGTDPDPMVQPLEVALDRLLERLAGDG